MMMKTVPNIIDTVGLAIGAVVLPPGEISNHAPQTKQRAAAIYSHFTGNFFSGFTVIRLIPSTGSHLLPS